MNDNNAHIIQLDGPYLDILSLRQSGLCCSQIIVKLALNSLGRENPDLVRAMAALCFGGGNPDGTCGVLTGAACALSLSLGNDPERERQDPLLALLLDELYGWFSVTLKDRHSCSGNSCADILAVSPDKRACTLLMIAALDKLHTMTTIAGGKESP
ncbi:MAG: C-GCAxxG-C-C family protein [Desulfuromonadaceae bacterium]|nr:C-GCAxxG-C-C family protein [Desulfuromonadaceae bacterium]